MAQGDFMERLLGGSKTQPSTYSSTPNSLGDQTGNEDYWGGGDGSSGYTGNEDYWSPAGKPYGDTYDSSLNRNNWSKIYEAPDGSMKANEKGEEPPNDEVDYDWNSLIKIYEDMAASANKATGEKGEKKERTETRDTDTWRNGNRSSSGYSGGSVIYQGPVYDYPELKRQEPFEYGATLDLPDYEPPEYDEGKERAVREEFIQTSKGAVSEAVQKAIIGSAAVNNPQARGQIIKAALEGFSASLGKSALAGSEAGRRAAEKKQATETGIYQVKFQIESKEKVAKYDADMRAELLNWELTNRQNDQEYAQQLSQWNSMPNDIKAKNAPGTNRLSMGGQGAMRI